MFKSLCLVLAIAGTAAFALSQVSVGPAGAHTGAMGVVKERMDMMDALARSMKAIKAGVLAKPEMDRAAIAHAAKAIADHADGLPKLFPKGTTAPPSEARPEIWQSWEAFVAAARTMKSEATKLAETAGTADRRAILGQFARTARSCGGCHERFRKAKQ